MVKEASVQGYSFGQRTAEGLGAGGGVGDTLQCRAEGIIGGFLYRAVSICVWGGAEVMVQALSPRAG